MGRRKQAEAMETEELRTQMLRGIRNPQTVALFDACGQRLAAEGRWDAISMRDIREACLLSESTEEYRTSCASLLREGDAKGASVMLKMRREADAARAEILGRWNLLPPRRRGRPPEETPADLRETPADDGWDDFGSPPQWATRPCGARLSPAGPGIEG